MSCSRPCGDRRNPAPSRLQLSSRAQLIDDESCQRLRLHSGDVVENRTDFGIFERAQQRGINYAAYPATCSAMRALASIHRETPKTSGNDAAIRTRILSALKKLTWSAEIQVDVLVRNGVVDLWGTADAGHRNALSALVHSVGNVKRINDHLFSSHEPS
jgi:hypothetical protein